MNVFVIHAYKKGDLWYFTDEDRKIIAEPFLSDASAIINTLADQVDPGAVDCVIEFSGTSFCEETTELSRKSLECGGVWYESKTLNMKGWLCPVFYKYFESAPDKLYVKVSKFKNKVDLGKT